MLRVWGVVYDGLCHETGDPRFLLPLRGLSRSWFDESCAVTPLRSEELEGLPNTYPFGL